MTPFDQYCTKILSWAVLLCSVLEVKEIPVVSEDLHWLASLPREDNSAPVSRRWNNQGCLGATPLEWNADL